MSTPGEPPPVRRKSILEFLPASMGGGSTETKRGTSVAPELEEKGNAVPASSGKGGLPPPKRGGDRRDPGYISRDTRRWLKYELEADTDDDLRQAQEEHAEAERRKQQSQSNEAAGGWKKKLFYRFDSWVSKRLNQSIFLAMTLFAFQIIFGILWLTVAWDDEVSAASGGCGGSSGWVQLYVGSDGVPWYTHEWPSIFRPFHISLPRTGSWRDASHQPPPAHGTCCLAKFSRCSSCSTHCLDLCRNKLTLDILSLCCVAHQLPPYLPSNLLPVRLRRPPAPLSASPPINSLPPTHTHLIDATDCHRKAPTNSHYFIEALWYSWAYMGDPGTHADVGDPDGTGDMVGALATDMKYVIAVLNTIIVPNASAPGASAARRALGELGAPLSAGRRLDGSVEVEGLSPSGPVGPGTADHGKRFVAMIIAVTGIILFAAVMGTVYDMISIYLDNLKKGKSTVVENEHTLILGWTDKTVPLIREICLANESEAGGIIVVLGIGEKEELEASFRTQVRL